jgi:hypothetical protein
MAGISMTRKQKRLTRSMVLFVAGLGGVIAETVYSLRFHQTPDSTLVLLFAAMMGLPVYLQQDAKRDSRTPSHPAHTDSNQSDSKSKAPNTSPGTGSESGDGDGP